MSIPEPTKLKQSFEPLPTDFSIPKFAQKPNSNNPVHNRRQVCSQQQSVLCPYCLKFLKSLLALVQNNPKTDGNTKCHSQTNYGHPDLIDGHPDMIQGHPQLSQGSSYRKSPFSLQKSLLAASNLCTVAKQSFSKPLEKDLANKEQFSPTPPISPDKGETLSPCHNKRPHLPLSCPYWGNCICGITTDHQQLISSLNELLFTPDKIPYHYKLPLNPLIASSEPSLEQISPTPPLIGVPKTKSDTPLIKRLLVEAKLKQSFKSRKIRLRLLRKALHLKKGKHNNTFASSKFIPNLLTQKAVNHKSTPTLVHPTTNFCASHAPKGKRFKPHYHTPKHQSLFTCKTPLQQIPSLLCIRF